MRGAAPSRWVAVVGAGAGAAGDAELEAAEAVGAALADEGVQRYTDGKPIRKFVYVRGKLANVVV